MDSSNFSLAEKNKRFQFCYELREKCATFWNGAFFCDELIFKFDEDGKLYLGQGSIPPKVGDNALAVWVCISQSGPICMSKIQGRYGSDQFVAIMKNNIVPILRSDADRVFIMDQFPVHICSAVKQWFNEQHGISLLLLPGKSGDFNIVSKIGGDLVKHLNSQSIDLKSVDELWVAVSNGLKTFCTPSVIQNALLENRKTMNNVCDC